MTFALHTGRTFTGCDDFRVAYRTYAHLAKDPLQLQIVKDPFTLDAGSEYALVAHDQLVRSRAIREPPRFRT
jgi:hypothetical protein